MKIKAILLLLSLSSIGILNFINQPKVNWVSWQQAQATENTSDKKYFVWIYDDTCKECKFNEKYIFTNQNVNYLNENYHSILFEAHEPNDILTKGGNYQNLGGKYHDLHALVLTLTQTIHQVSFPAIVFLDENMDLIAPINGDTDAKELLNYLTFVKDDFFFYMNINEYENSIVGQ